MTGIRTTEMHKFITVLIFTLLLSSCASIPASSPPELVGYTETGNASFYSSFYQFQKTASGERCNQLALTAAHRTLPFGTRVRVTNVDNSRSVVVKINDRGPFIDGRIIDLTRSAFGDIADTSAGIVAVQIEVVD